MSDKAPIDFFHLMVTDQMLEEVLKQTRLYAQQFVINKANTSLELTFGTTHLLT